MPTISKLCVLIDASALCPSGLSAEFAHDQVVHGRLALSDQRLAHLGVTAELSSAPTTGDDVLVIGRIVIVDHDGVPTIEAFEGDPVSHRALP